MRDEHFDTLSRVLSSGATWRGILSAVAGVAGLQVTETAAARRERTKRRTGRRVGTEQAFTIAEGCPAPAPVSIELLSAFYPGYWWDHTHLTAAVQAHPKADPTLIAAAREAIAIWDRILRREFNNEVTLTDVTDTQRPAHKADIVLHFVPRAGGTSFEGYAICGSHKCNNVLIKSDKPKPEGLDPFNAAYLGWTVLHELGHALGLGHAEPLEQTNDLMGYGWTWENFGDPAPVLSPCDLKALREVFAWFLAGEEPHPPTVPSITCDPCLGP